MSIWVTAYHSWLYNLHCIHCFLNLSSRACRLGFTASASFPFACHILALHGFLLLFCFPLHVTIRIAWLSTSVLLPFACHYSHCMVFCFCFVFPCLPPLCIAWFPSDVLLLACIAFRAVMLIVCSSYEPRHVRFRTLTMLLSTYIARLISITPPGILSIHLSM